MMAIIRRRCCSVTVVPEFDAAFITQGSQPSAPNSPDGVPESAGRM